MAIFRLSLPGKVTTSHDIALKQGPLTVLYLTQKNTRQYGIPGKATLWPGGKKFFHCRNQPHIIFPIFNRNSDKRII